jgi:hypothetical protein
MEQLAAKNPDDELAQNAARTAQLTDGMADLYSDPITRPVVKEMIKLVCTDRDIACSMVAMLLAAVDKSHSMYNEIIDAINAIFSEPEDDDEVLSEQMVDAAVKAKRQAGQVDLGEELNT